MIVAARSRVSARNAELLFSATLVSSTASMSMSCIFAGWSRSSFAKFFLPNCTILMASIAWSCTKSIFVSVMSLSRSLGALICGFSVLSYCVIFAESS